MCLSFHRITRNPEEKEKQKIVAEIDKEDFDENVKIQPEANEEKLENQQRTEKRSSQKQDKNDLKLESYKDLEFE